jgi:hypothetical protein
MSVIYSDGPLFDVSGAFYNPPFVSGGDGGGGGPVGVYKGDISIKIYAGYTPGQSAYTMYADLKRTNGSAIPGAWVNDYLNYSYEGLSGETLGDLYLLYIFIKSTDLSGSLVNEEGQFNIGSLQPTAPVFVFPHKLNANSQGDYELNKSPCNQNYYTTFGLLGSDNNENAIFFPVSPPNDIILSTTNPLNVVGFYCVLAASITSNNLSLGNCLKFKLNKSNLFGLANLLISGKVPNAFATVLTDFANPTYVLINCLLKGTKVKILGGYKLIENIKVGDFILSHKGQLVQVLKTVSWDIKWSETATNESNTVYKIPVGELGCNENTYISAYHQILIDGKLVAAKDAGLELARESEVGSEFTFYHLQVVNYVDNHLVVNGNCIVESWCGELAKQPPREITATKINIGNLAKKVLTNTTEYLKHLTPKFMKRVNKVGPK